MPNSKTSIPTPRPEVLHFAGFALGLALFVGTLLAPPIPSLIEGGEPLSPVAQRTLAATLLIATWWMTAPLPMPATSLLPLVLFPLLGVLSAQQTSKAFVNDSLFLFLGGFILSQGIERWGLNRRIALWVLLAMGTSPRRLVFGMMVACGGLSMWISNGAAALTILPIGLALVDSLTAPDESGERSPEQIKLQSRFAVALLLGITYAASVGGMATPIGTPPNVIAIGVLRQMFPNAPPITTANWILAFMPMVAVFIVCIWLTLTWGLGKTTAARSRAGRELIREELAKLGPMTLAEALMLGLFAVTAALWIFRQDLEMGALTIPGWSGAFERLAHSLGWTSVKQSSISDSTVAIGMAALMFLIPLPRDDRGRPQRLMDWETAVKLPWGVLLLVGGGFAVADGFQETGLSHWVGQQFLAMRGWSPEAMIVGVCTLMTFLTEVTSNTATTSLMAPILASSAASLQIDPRLLVLPAAISASCAFMLPVATLPNAIVFATGRIRLMDMVRYGLVINLIGIVVVSAGTWLFALPAMGIDPSTMPDWAATSAP